MDRPPDVTIRRLRADETPLLRALRLRALAEAPAAFGERHDDISARAPEYWDELARSLTAPGRHVMFVAERGAQPVGMAFALRDGDRADVGRLGGMWVDPAHRGHGAAQALTEAVLDWARRQRFRRVELSVTDGNDAARRVYERCGFADTGGRRPLPSNPSRLVIGMARDL